MSLWPLRLCKIVKQSVQQNQSCEDAPFWVLNDPFVLKKNFFGKAINMIFMYLSAPFIVQNLKKKFLEPSGIMRMCHFRVQNGPFSPNKTFFDKNHKITSNYLLVSFIVKNVYKKFLLWIFSYEDAPFLGQKWSICPT